MALLKRISFTNNDTMYILGDIIDRGPKPVELLKFIYEHDNIIPLMGNHEEFLLDYVDKGFAGDTVAWDKNDGEVTRLAIDKLRKDDPALCENIMNDMKGWSSCLVLGPYVLSHAGYNAARLKNLPPTIESLKKMTLADFTWSREDFYKCKGIDDHITIFGHTPTRSIRTAFSLKKSDDIWVCARYGDKIGIDGAVAYGGQLNCVNLDEMEITVIKPGALC